MSKKFDEFRTALFDLCKKHRVALSISIEDSIIVEDAEDESDSHSDFFVCELTDHTKQP